LARLQVAPQASFRLGHRPVLDGLRGIALLAVLFHHSPLAAYVRGGFLGVDLFFVLSGFLITTLLLQEHADRGSISLKHFYLRRVLRLLPALVALLLFSCLFAHYLLPAAHAKSIYRAALLTLCYGANLHWLFRVDLNILAHAWSLSLEEQFYLLWPIVLVLLLGRRMSQWRTLVLAVLGMVAAASLRAGLFWMLEPSPYASVVTATCLVTRADSLLAGCLVGMLACWNKLPQSPSSCRVLNGVALAAGATLIVVWVGTPYEATYLYYGGSTLIAAAMAVCVAALVTAPSPFFSRLLSARALVWTGRLSYGLYLWHFPMWTFVTRLTFKFMPDVNTHGIVSYWPFQIIMTFVMAVISFHCVEQPFLRLKERLARPGARHTEPQVSARAA
jgi:peptidoglycan/LPS O-acetylase OafA/YrhL